MEEAASPSHRHSTGPACADGSVGPQGTQVREKMRAVHGQVGRKVPCEGRAGLESRTAQVCSEWQPQASGSGRRGQLRLMVAVQALRTPHLEGGKGSPRSPAHYRGCVGQEQG